MRRSESWKCTCPGDWPKNLSSICLCEVSRAACFTDGSVMTCTARPGVLQAAAPRRTRGGVHGVAA